MSICHLADPHAGRQTARTKTKWGDPQPRVLPGGNILRGRDIMEITGKTALVTGANRGLGRHLAAELRDRGARVYAAARDPQAVDLTGIASWWKRGQRLRPP